MRRVLVALAILCSGLCQPALALDPEKPLHQYLRDSWSLQQGLPQISVLALAQDDDGYIWAGTQGGLARFDGIRFVTFNTENTPELPGNWVQALYRAPGGTLWIGTYKGVASYDGQRFHNIPLAGSDSGLQLDIRAFAMDDRENLWVASTTGIHQVRNGRLTPVASAPPIAAYALLARGSQLWAGAEGAVYRLSDDEWETLPLPGDAASATVTHLAEAHGRVWAATSVGLYVHSSSGWIAAPGIPELRDTPVEMLFTDHDDNLWAGGDVGLARIHDGTLTAFAGVDEPGTVLTPRSAFEDREGSLWLGSQWDGLTRLSQRWTERFSTVEGLEDRIVWSLSPDPDDSRTWLGTNDGVALLDQRQIRQVIPGSVLPHPQAYNLLAERDRLWIGTRRGLMVANVANLDHPVVTRPAMFAPLDGARINGFVRLDNGDFWIPTNEGLFLVHDGVLRRYGEADGLADPRIRMFFRTSQGRILAASQSGLFELRGERFEQLGLQTGLPRQIDVTSIAELADGRLVIGTLDEQVYFHHKGRWHDLGGTPGMPSNAPFYMLQYQDNLIAGGIRGITRVQVAELTALAGGRIDRVHGEMLLNDRGDQKSGQQGYCCNGAGNSKGFVRGTRMWLPIRDGAVALDFDAIKMNPIPPGIVIERVQTNHTWQSASPLRDTTLPSNTRDLSFEFTVLSFQDPRNADLKYRLIGYDQDWQQADLLNRNVRYTNLPSGDYVFEVTGSNNAGVASRKPARLPFSIAPRFHETGWFFAVAGLLLGTVFYAGFRYQRRRHRLRQGALEALVQQRTQALELANERLEMASQTDPLTGLHNRRYVTRQIPVDLAYYDRQVEDDDSGDDVLLFALVDIDHFKSVNDRHGHKAGDEVLQQFADILRSLMRTGDYVVRWGGEEFLVILRPMPGADVTALAERLRITVSSHTFMVGSAMAIHLTCSIGLSEYPRFRNEHHELGWESMIELADQALYLVKSCGRDGWAVFQPTNTTNLATLMDELRAHPWRLIDSGQLHLTGSSPRIASCH